MSSRSMFDLTGRVALVTGGARGLGRALSLGMAAFGANLALIDLELEGAGAVLEELKKECPPIRNHVAVKADISQAAQVEAAVQEVLDAFGPGSTF